MGSDMTCFDWSNQASSYLDGSLNPGLKKVAEAHLESCKDCRERHQRYRLILDSLGSLPRISAPASIKYEREAREKGNPTKSTRGWTPYDRFVRPLVKPLRDLSPRTWSWISASILGFIALTALPKLQALYDARLQKRLEAVNFAELPVTQAPPQETGETEDLGQLDDFSGDEGEEDPSQFANGSSSNTTEGGLQRASWEGEWDPSKHRTTEQASSVPGAQVWRFILRTDSPQDLRSKVHQVLLKSGVSPQAKMIHGFVAPGGIQFDVLAPARSIPDLRDALEKLSEEHSPAADPSSTDNPYPTQPFTWYRNRSKRPIPSGAARVVIWLSLT
jgi:hypothetical protein